MWNIPHLIHQALFVTMKLLKRTQKFSKLWVKQITGIFHTLDGTNYTKISWINQCKIWHHKLLIIRQYQEPNELTFSNIHLVLSFITDISLFSVFPLFFRGRFDVINARCEPISRIKWRNHFRQIIFSTVLLSTVPLWIFLPLLPQMVWLHWMLHINNLKHQIKATFPSFHLLICSLFKIVSLKT